MLTRRKPWNSRRHARGWPAILCAFCTALNSPTDLRAQRGAQAATASERVFSDSPSTFFEDYPTWARVSPDGRWAIYAGWTGVRILDLEAKRLAPEQIWSGVSNTYSAAWGPQGSLILYGSRDGKRGWYENLRVGPRLLPLPPGASPLWSPDGSRVAYSLESAPDSVYVGALGEPRAWHVAGRGITGMAWLPDGTALLVLAAQTTGTSNLVRVEISSGAQRVVAADLDAAPLPPSPVAAAPDGRRAYVALASARAPARAAPPAPCGPPAGHLRDRPRHREAPAGDPSPGEGGDAIAPSVGGGNLYWTVSRSDASVVVLPAAGGQAELVTRGALVPSWRPDGRQIGFSYGDWRWADWAIAWDGGAVAVDAGGRPMSPVQPIIAGYHEDFQPVWSPRGHWIAYHSHREKAPDPYYDAPGATDDIWLRPVGVPARDSAEIRLTDFGWETGPPDWSQDGTRLVFTSYDRAGAPGVDQPYLVSIDTATGRALTHGRLPVPPEIHNGMSVAWSPVNDEIALEEKLAQGRHALWIVASDRKSARKVIEFPLGTYGGLSWTRDGKAIIYTALVQGRMQLFSIAVNGGAPKQLSHDTANLFELAVSPDGRLIAAARLAHAKEVWKASLPQP